MEKKKGVVARAASLLAVCMLAVASVVAIAPQSQAASVSATYMTYDQVKGKWLPTVVNNSDYAGNYGNGVSGVAIELSGGYQVTYDVHQMNDNRWLSSVTGFNTGDDNNGFAGNLGSNTIDAVMVKTNAPVQVEYRVHIRGGNWLPAVTGYNTSNSSNGYAGNIGQAIDAVQVWFAGTTTTTTTTTASGELSPASAKAVAKSLMSNYGWNNSTQYTCLVDLWNRESGWRWNADNPSSGAYGIPQALPANKMATVSSDWRTNATTQIKWGLKYISGKYGTPCSAWSHEEKVGWY